MQLDLNQQRNKIMNQLKTIKKIKMNRQTEKEMLPSRQTTQIKTDTKNYLLEELKRQTGEQRSKTN